MRRYGSKKASRPFKKLHRDCGECSEYEAVKTKSRRAYEKGVAQQLIDEQLAEAE